MNENVIDVIILEYNYDVITTYDILANTDSFTVEVVILTDELVGNPTKDIIILEANA